MSMTDSMNTVFQTDLPLPGRRQGKVRDIYEVPGDANTPPRMLIIASDRISAFDVVLPTPVPGKGCMLTGIAEKWFDFVRELNIIEDHLLSTRGNDVPGISEDEAASIDGRVMVGRACEVIPVEFVVRGYLAGSGWVEYQQNQSVCGVSLPAGLMQCSQLPEPIFTPATKATVGHDENIDFETSCSIAGKDVMEHLRTVSLNMYNAAAEYARARGIILADTKFEFGYPIDHQGNRCGEPILIDEILTPDSSRFWPAEEYEAGRDQNSFDKQYVRNHLLGMVKAGSWDKTPPGPELPDEIISNTLKRYREARDRLFD